MPKNKKFDWKGYFFGRKLTKEDLFRDRLRICSARGLKPKDISNFWEGIEELKLQHCAHCGKKLSANTRKVSKIIKPNYILCADCNPHPIHPF